MRILVVAATEFEVGGLTSQVLSQKPGVEGKEAHPVNLPLTTHHSPITTSCSLLITGVGMVATAFSLGTHLAKNQYDLAINLGIAGSFDRSIALGNLVEITEDTLAELGAEDDQQFISIENLGFGESAYKASASLADYYQQSNIKKATAITVNTVHGNDGSIEQVKARLRPQIESMEGAAFFFACKQVSLPCIQIRAVSNYVEKRNRDAWQIGLAIKNLNSFAVSFLLNGLQ